MTKAIFAGKKIEKFPGDKVLAACIFYAKFSWLSKNFFAYNSPRNASNRNRKYEEPHNLSPKHSKILVTADDYRE